MINLVLVFPSQDYAVMVQTEMMKVDLQIMAQPFSSKEIQVQEYGSTK
ncbi:MAG: hypothetical protein IPJ39_22120 [Saprospiraceae bacterium]|nr:hypothetical protein [Saprospiraceae bacterium]